MRTYVVRRPAIGASAAELDAALMRLRSFEEKPGGLPVRWMHSYALREPDGRFGLTCVLQSDGQQSLERHAAQTRLPAREILPVIATLPARPFAPTMVYLVRRRSVWRSAADLQRAAAIARRIGDEDMAREVSWLHSHAIDEGDGTLGTVCLYQALDAEVLRQHATRAGMPADEIVPVLGRIVFREDATPPSAHGSAVPA